MDSISQAALGAAVGEALLGKKIGNKGAILGAIVGTIPDLDVLLTPFYTQLQNISIHRGYSHSILACIISAFLLTYLFKKIKWTSEVAHKKLWIFSFLGLFTHVLLDAFTSYGTQLFLPFTDWRVSFGSVNILDPVYTVPLLLGLVGSLYFYKKSPHRNRYNAIGLGVSTLYLLFTLANKQHIEQVVKTNLTTQNIPYNQLQTIPVAIANVTWYGVAKDDKNLYLGKYSELSPAKIDFEKFPINDHLLNGLDPYLVDRMKWFSQQYYTVAEHEGKVRLYNLQCDMQGVRTFGNYKAPTSFYFEINPHPDGSYELSTGMHPKE